jgi:hypothetical protein
MMWRTNIRIWSDAQTDFTPAAGYETIDAGLNLSTTWGPSQPALPGMSPGYFAGTAPDLGAIEFGAVIAPPLGVPKLSGKIVLSGRIQLE